ncbi:hypothetical protein [Alsobacter sp. R-9]
MAIKIAETLGSGDLAKLLGVTPRYIQKLAADGVLPPPVSRNQYDTAASVTAFVEHLRREAREVTKTAAASRVADARAREIELRVAKAEGRVCDVEEAFGAVDAIAGKLVEGLGALPARIARHDFALRARVEDECRRLSNEIADEAQRQADKHAAGIAAAKARRKPS